MKRILVFLLTLLTLTGLLTACGECSHEYDNPTDIHCNNCDYNRLAITWTTTIGDQPGEMTLKADGTGSIISSGHTRPCTWEIKENTLTVIQDADGFAYVFLNGVDFAFEENTLTVTSQKGNTLVFNKK